MFPLLPLESKAGAWAQPEGRGLSILTYRFYETDQVFDDNGARRDLPNGGEFTKHEANLYVEYGLPHRLTLIASLFLQDLHYSDDAGASDSNFGLSDPEVGLRWQFLEKEHWPKMALQFVTKVPGPYSLSDTPILGNDQFDFETVLFVGDNHKLLGRDGFWEIGFGPRARLGAPSDQLRWFATIGWRLTERFEWIGQLEGTHGLGNDRPQVIGENVTATTDYTLLKATMQGVYHLNQNWSISAGPVIHYYGEKTGAGGGAQASLWFRF
ncbi:MAG: hypothetical protein OHK005_17850 [Candidatus Methylacidiphilales bacterium]